MMKLDNSLEDLFHSLSSLVLGIRWCWLFSGICQLPESPTVSGSWASEYSGACSQGLHESTSAQPNAISGWTRIPIGASGLGSLDSVEDGEIG
jgi:hypothetical protein